MNVAVIVKKYLEDNNYDGLCCSECGCLLDDLIPCNEFFGDCVPGYKLHKEMLIKNADDYSHLDWEDEDYDYFVVAKKPIKEQGDGL